MSSFYADSVVSRKYDDSQMFTLDRLNRLERNAGKISDRWDFFGLVCLRVWGLFYHYEVHRGKGHIFKGNKCFWNFIIVTESFFSHAEIQR